MAHRLLVGLMILPVAFAVSACGRSAPPPAEQSTVAAPAQPPVDTSARMAEHFGKVRELEDAIVRGDLETAKETAQWIAEHQEAAGLPAGTEGYVTATKNAARAVAASSSLGNAGVAAAFAVAACGECHTAVKITAKMPDVSVPPTRQGVAAAMFVPSETLWKQGAGVLQGSPLRENDLTKVPEEIVASETRVHDLARRADQAADAGSKIAIYGELIGGCASCHGKHGMVLGAGAPKPN
jgi:cytochrome c553